MSRTRDAIVVGARCAGAPTAMLLARAGYDVLLVDKATFPSDTVSTHLIHPPGVAALRRWGLLDRLVATKCPAISSYTFDLGPFAITGAPGTPEEPVSYAPRRTILDEVLLEAAVEAGAEVRTGFLVDEVRTDDGRVVGIRGHERGGGRPVVEDARYVVGADGRHSTVARAVAPDAYHEKPPLLYSYYSYWRDVPDADGFETYVRPDRAFAIWPTHDDLTLVIAGRPFAEHAEFRRDVDRNVWEIFDLVPAFAERLRAGTRVERYVGAAVENYFRKPYGPGWVLVGDAGYNKDYVTAQGIADAFRDAERCVAALDEVLTGRRPASEAMEAYRRDRDDASLGIYELTTELATLEPPPPDLQALLAATARDREASDAFVRVNTGVIPPTTFFAEDNVRRILAGA